MMVWHVLPGCLLYINEARGKTDVLPLAVCVILIPKLF